MVTPDKPQKDGLKELFRAELLSGRLIGLGLMILAVIFAFTALIFCFHVLNQTLRKLPCDETPHGVPASGASDSVPSSKPDDPKGQNPIAPPDFCEG